MPSFFRCVLFLVGFHLASILAAQQPLDQLLRFQCDRCVPSEALVALSRQSGINIVFNDRFFQDCPPVYFSGEPMRLREILDRFSECGRVSYRALEGSIVFYRKNRRFSISGFVQDAETGERIIGASVRAGTGKNAGAISNEFGFFSLTLEEGAYTLAINALGYQSRALPISLDENRKLTVALRANLALPEVVVSGQVPDTFAQRIGPDPNIPALGNLSGLPMPGGEADLLRLVAMQPGVQTGVDGLGGLHVRGGNSDQNLILLDDVPVYNPSHALGLFSIFNPATLNNVRFWKGDFPARYGGRAASVLDIRTRDGNFREYKAGASVGLFAASLSAEGPVVRDKSSFLASGRFTYFQPWVQFFSRRDNLLTFSGDRVVYRFHDLNLKWNYTFSEKNRLYCTFYSGGDAFRDQFVQRYASTQGLLTERYTLGSSWGNTIAAARWNHLLSNRLFSNTTFRFSRFFYQSQLSFDSRFLYPNGKENVLADYGQLYQTLIRDLSVKTDFTFFPSNALTVRWGVALTRHDFQPGALSVNFLLPGQSAASIDSLAALLLNNERLSANENEAYLDFEWRFAPRWQFDAGLNASIFQIRNTNYPNLLPRLRIAHAGKRGVSTWAGYSRMAQNLHQIGSFNISLPFELWVPSTAKVPPERVWQSSLGIGYQRKHWRIQAEGYYKRFDRVLAFLSANDALYTGGAEDASGWEDRIAVGTGLARGIEWSFGLDFPATSFSAGYTLSKAERNFPDLNSGRTFPFRFDRRHDLKINLRQRITAWLSADAAWSYATGNPITLAGLRYTHHSPNSDISRDVYVYTTVNGYRLPAVHRLDFSLQARFPAGRLQHSIQLGAYNAYNRPNPFFIFIDAGSGIEGKAIQYTLLPLLPIFRYEINFAFGPNASR